MMSLNRRKHRILYFGVLNVLNRIKIKVMRQLSDLAPSDVGFLFPKLEERLKRTGFQP